MFVYILTILYWVSNYGNALFFSKGWRKKQFGYFSWIDCTFNIILRLLIFREINLNSGATVSVNQNTVILNPITKEDGGKRDALGERGTQHKFTFDYSYWSHNPKDAHFVTQDKVFQVRKVKFFLYRVLSPWPHSYSICSFMLKFGVTQVRLQNYTGFRKHV